MEFTSITTKQLNAGRKDFICGVKLAFSRCTGEKSD
jgi:hypothetical protein